jgi:hypothetical protein
MLPVPLKIMSPDAKIQFCISEIHFNFSDTLLMVANIPLLRYPKKLKLIIALQMEQYCWLHSSFLNCKVLHLILKTDYV